MRYRKGVPWALTKNLIERNTYDGVQNYVNHVFGNLRKYLASTTRPVIRAASAPVAPAPVQIAAPPVEYEDEDEDTSKGDVSTYAFPFLYDIPPLISSCVILII